jgi:hypothetical protein
MKRRRFLQLAASAGAAAVVRHSSALASHPAAADVLSLTVGDPPLASYDAPHVEFGARRRPAVEPRFQEFSGTRFVSDVTTWLR